MGRTDLTNCKIEEVTLDQPSRGRQIRSFCATHEWIGYLPPGHSSCKYFNVEYNLMAIFANYFNYRLLTQDRLEKAILPPLPAQAPKVLDSTVSDLLRDL